MVRNRIVILTFILTTLFGVVLVRLGCQQLDPDRQEVMAHRSLHLDLVHTSPQRGRIVARNGEVLADNEALLALEFVGRRLNPRRRLVKLLVAELNAKYPGFTTVEEIKRRMLQLAKPRELATVASLADGRGTVSHLLLLEELDASLVKKVKRKWRSQDLFEFRSRSLSEDSTWDLYFDPYVAARQEIVLRRLARRLARGLSAGKTQSEDSIYLRLLSRVERNRWPGRLELLWNDVPLSVATAVEYYPGSFRGIRTAKRSRRVYPFGELTGSLLGHLRELSADEISTARASGQLLEARAPASTMHLTSFRLLQASYRSRSARRGERGLEGFYDDTLRGAFGARLFRVDPRHRPVEGVDYVSAIDGRDIRMTIDLTLQRKLHQKLGALLRPGTPFYGDAASALVMDLQSGALLACVGLPAVNPNRLREASYYSELEKKWQGRTHGWLLNRPIEHRLYPGSLFKLVLSVAAMENAEELSFSPRERFECHGPFHLWDKVKCNARYGHGELALAAALRHSCNNYFYFLGWKRLGGERIYRWAKTLGYGVSPEIDFKGRIAQGELRHPSRVRERELCRYSIGQLYVQASPLQVLRGIATIATRGRLLEPHLVISDLTSPATKIQFRNPRTFEVINDGLWGAAHDPGGTASADDKQLWRYRVAVKTATAEIDRKRDGEDLHNVWIAGYAPAAPSGKPAVNSRIAFVVVVERSAGHGADACAPVVEVILDHFEAQEPGVYQLTPVGQGR